MQNKKELLDKLSSNPVQRVILQSLAQQYEDQHDDIEDMANWIAALKKMVTYIETDFDEHLWYKKESRFTNLDLQLKVNKAMNDWKK